MASKQEILVKKEAKSFILKCPKCGKTLKRVQSKQPIAGREDSASCEDCKLRFNWVAVTKKTGKKSPDILRCPKCGSNAYIPSLNTKELICLKCGKTENFSQEPKQAVSKCKPFVKGKVAITQQAKDKSFPVPDMLMWVGQGFYGTPEDYIAEARKMGCCKRLRFYPRFIQPGKSRVFLAHPMGHSAKNKGDEPTGKIFGYFDISRVELIVEGDVTGYLKDRNIVPVSLADVLDEGERGCGKRKIGLYISCSPKDFEAMKDAADAAEVSSKLITVLDKPIEIKTKHFRNFRYVAGDRILEKAPEKSWFLSEHLTPLKAKHLRKKE